LKPAVDSGNYDHITTDDVVRELAHGDIFAFLARALGTAVDLSTYSDEERFTLVQAWRMHAYSSKPRQFGVTSRRRTRAGLPPVAPAAGYLSKVSPDP
jgi:hypothetical protein